MQRSAMRKVSTDAAPEGCVFRQLKPTKLESVLTEIPHMWTAPPPIPGTATTQGRK
jgi:hypothetical protein